MPEPRRLPWVGARELGRRGHGRSTQVGDGHDMDHYADDLAALRVLRPTF